MKKYIIIGLIAASAIVAVAQATRCAFCKGTGFRPGSDSNCYQCGGTGRN